jgi:Arc/MetJ-type ribon-helix-helix transcriptional regulator
MRQTITISLPRELKRFVDEVIEEGNFSTTSEFFRDLIRERQAVAEVWKSAKEIRSGKGKVLRSLRSLR